MDLENALAALRAHMGRVQRTLARERALRLAGLPVAVLTFWLCASLVGLPARLGPLAASVLGVIALLIAVSLAIQAMLRNRPPSDAEVRARIAADGGLERGALDVLEDAPARLDPISLALWRREQMRAAAAATRAAAAPAAFDWARADPRNLRFAAPIALAIALLIAGSAAPDRLARALLPDPGPLLGDRPIAIEAWATPADYTGAGPVSLSDRMGERIPTAPGPLITVRLTGPAAPPTLEFRPKSGLGDAGRVRKLRFVRGADGAYEARIEVTGEGRLAVRRFHEVAQWRIVPAPDKPPAARLTRPPALAEAPEGAATERIAFDWSATDDFGVRRLALRARPVTPPPGLAEAAPFDVPFQAPAGDPRTSEGSAEIDLAAHPYAGMQVRLSVVAFDAIGQAGESAGAELRLPEKVFLQPLARAAIEIRKTILHERRAYAAAPRRAPVSDRRPDDFLGVRFDEDDPRITRAPRAIRRAGQLIEALTIAPEDGYFRDRTVFAGFRLARAHLNVARSIDDTGIAADVLWEVALRAEYGDAADARRAFEMAQKALAEALARGADQEEIDRLSDALAQATRNLIESMVREAMRQNKPAETQEDAVEQDSRSMADVQKMLDEIKRRAEAGDQAGAQAMMQQLNQMLANMEIRLASAPGGPEQGQDGQSSALEQTIDRLGEQISRQRALNDDTAQAEQQDQGGAEGAQQRQELAERQEQLQRDLKALEQETGAQGAGEGRKDLDQAGEAMDQAAKSIGQGDLEGAAEAQARALRDLRRGAERLSAEAAQKRKSRSGRSQSNETVAEEDPLGRQLGQGSGEGNETKVPTEVEKQHAREILDELRARSQDPARSETERAYLRRLLDRFTGS